MAMTAKALLMRINEMKRVAMAEYASNPYVTIHDYSRSESAEKRNPYSLWIDLNYPVYVLKDGKPVLQQGIKDVCILFKTTYPDERPTIKFPVSVASIHMWNNNYACTHTVYNPQTHNLTKEIANIMTLAANCPEGINYLSPTSDHKWLIDWTKESLRSGVLPTVPYQKLFMVHRSTRRNMRRI